MWKPLNFFAENYTSFEQIEHHIDEGCYVVLGENKDNRGQKSNGSGKSAFMDIMPIALTGESLTGRDLKNCVNWNGTKDYFIVGVDLVHEDGRVAIIQRKIYNKATKASELTIIVNGQTPSEIPTKAGVKGALDVKAGNEYILNEILGFTKKDLFNYYLISGATYTSFMKSTNGEKLDAINRFSNGTLIDDCIDYVSRVDLNSKRMERDDLITKKGNVEAKIEALMTTLSGMTQQQFEENQKLKLDKVQDLKNVSKKEIDLLTSNISELERLLDKEKSIAESTEKPSSSEYEENRATLNTEMKDIDLDIKDIKSQYNKFCERQRSECAALQQLCDKLEEESIEVKQGISDIRSSLLGVISCPKCSHKFFSEEHEHEQSVEELTAQLQQMDELLLEVCADWTREIERLDKLKVQQDLNEDRERKKMDKAIARKNQERSEVQSQLSKLREEFDQNLEQWEIAQQKVEMTKRSIKSKQPLIKSYQEGLDKYDKMISDIEKERYEDSVVSFQEDIKKYKKSLITLGKSIEEASAQYTKVEQWIANFEDFKFFMANKPIQAICDLINLYLRDNDSDLSVHIEGFRNLRNGKLKQELNPMVLRDGRMEQFSAYSEGERARINISADLAFQHIVNSTSKTGGLNYYQNDELISGLDSTGVANAAKAFDNLGKPILLVTHSGADLVYKKRITICKEDKISVLL